MITRDGIQEEIYLYVELGFILTLVLSHNRLLFPSSFFHFPDPCFLIAVSCLL